MSLKTTLLKQAAATAEVMDHTEVSKFTGAALPEVGKAPARLVRYVEVGTHPQPDYAGKAKDPCEEVRLTFEVFGAKNTREIELEGGGTKKAGRLLTVQTTIKLNERAKFYKLFQAMRAGRDNIKTMPEMLDEVFLVTIAHGEGKKSKKPYATFYTGSDYNIGAPIVEKFDDEGNIEGTINLTEKTPPASVDHQLFVVEKPSLDQWNSIEIEGTYTRKARDEKGAETGEEEEVSKNFLQEKIKDSLDWEGSAMQALLLDLGEEIEEADEVEEEEGVAEEPVEEPKKKAKKSSAQSATKKSKATTKKSSASATTATKSPSKVEEDDDTAALLAECGL